MISSFNQADISASELQQLDTDSQSKLITELLQSKADLEARRFVETGLAKFADLMRWQPNDTLSSWVDRLLVEMSPAIGALQACMYMTSLKKQDVHQINGNNGQVNQDRQSKQRQQDNEESYLETDNRELLLVGAYAHDDENTFSVIKFGKGLVGQAAKSKRTIAFSQNAKIETRAVTGLASLHPQALIIQPLIYNDTVEGVLEISAIEDFSAQQIDFIKSLSESIAANLMTIRSQEEMRYLYIAMQAKTESLTAQEEEMRQNMEEMAATQEELSRLRSRAEQQAALQLGTIDSLDKSLIAVDNNLNVVLFNTTAKKMSDNLGTKLEINSRIEDYYCRETIRAIQKDLWNRALNGESFHTEGTRYSMNGKSEQIFAYGYFPIYNLKKTEIIGACVLERNMTEERKKQLEVVDLKNNAEQQSAYFKSLLDGMESGMITLDLNYNAQSINKKAGSIIKFFGLELLTGSNYLDLFPEDQREFINDHLLKASKGRKSEITIPSNPENFEECKWFNIHFAPMFESNNMVTGIIIEFKEETEKIRQHLKIEQLNQIATLENKLRQNVIDSLDTGLIAIDQNYTLMIANEPAKQILGKFGLVLNLGVKLDQDMNPDYQDYIMEDYRRAMNGEVIKKINKYKFNEESDEQTFETVHSPIFNHDKSEIEGVLTIFKNITNSFYQSLSIENCNIDDRVQRI